MEFISGKTDLLIYFYTHVTHYKPLILTGVFPPWMQTNPTSRHKVTVVTVVRIAGGVVLIVTYGMEARVVCFGIACIFILFFIKSNNSTSLFSSVSLLEPECLLVFHQIYRSSISAVNLLGDVVPLHFQLDFNLTDVYLNSLYHLPDVQYMYSSKRPCIFCTFPISSMHIYR